MRQRFVNTVLLAILFIADSAYCTTACDEFAARLPNMTRALCDAAGLAPSPARSAAGRIVWMRDVKPEHVATRVLVIGAIHGDELSSASLALHWIRLATQTSAASPQPIYWRFIPALNPDGLFSQPPRRVNANGVDLNRNFPTPHWERDAKVYWEKRTGRDPRRYPGPKPLSEPESRLVHEEILRFRPQLIVSIHAPYGVLDFDGPEKRGPVPPSRLGRLYLDQVGIFPGSLGNYGGVHKGIPVVTIELPNSTRTPLDAEIEQMWRDLLHWTAEHIPPADADGKLPVALSQGQHGLPNISRAQR
jgi:murein peptide amidase A